MEELERNEGIQNPVQSGVPDKKHVISSRLRTPEMLILSSQHILRNDCLAKHCAGS